MRIVRLMTWMWTIAISLASIHLSVAAANDVAVTKSRLETDPEGWIDIMPGANLQGWQRVPILPATTLESKNAWHLDDGGKVLRCAGVGIKEMLLYERPFVDGTFHLEWRFQKVDGDPEYNSGAYVRTTDGGVWHQVQIAHTRMRPLLGDVFGEHVVDDKRERWVVAGDGHTYARPPGEWNTYEIRCQGREIVVWINGHDGLTWKECPVRKGRIGLQAEFFDIEFRQLKFKETR